MPPIMFAMPLTKDLLFDSAEIRDTLPWSDRLDILETLPSSDLRDTSSTDCLNDGALYEFDPKLAS